MTTPISMLPSRWNETMKLLNQTTGEEFHLKKGGNTTIGRGPENDLVFPVEPVSRRHAQVFWDGLDCAITDLGSTNGTTVNDRRLLPGQPHPLRPGDDIRLGGEISLVVGVVSEPIVSPVPGWETESSSPTRWVVRLIAGAAVVAAILLVVLGVLLILTLR